MCCWCCHQYQYQRESRSQWKVMARLHPHAQWAVAGAPPAGAWVSKTEPQEAAKRCGGQARRPGVRAPRELRQPRRANLPRGPQSGASPCARQCCMHMGIWHSAMPLTELSARPRPLSWMALGCLAVGPGLPAPAPSGTAPARNGHLAGTPIAPELGMCIFLQHLTTQWFNVDFPLADHLVV